MKRQRAINTWCLSAAIALLAGLCTVTAAAAQDAVADFFKGKQINIIVGSSAGGGYDTYARLLARYFGNHIPGNPSVVVQNMPGAGEQQGGRLHLLGRAEGWHRTSRRSIRRSFCSRCSRPRWAATIRASSSISAAPTATSTSASCAAMRRPRPCQDTFTHEVILGASAEGGTTRDLPAMLNNLSGPNSASSPAMPAARRSRSRSSATRCNGTCGIGWTGLPTMHPDWFAKKLRSRVMAQTEHEGPSRSQQDGRAASPMISPRPTRIAR